MQNQFSVRPSEYLSGFVPVNSHEKQRNYGGPNLYPDKVKANTKINNNSPKPSSAWSATTKSPLHTTKLFARNKLRGEDDLRDNYVDLNERQGKQANLREGHDVLSAILQKYRNKQKKIPSKPTKPTKGVRTSKGASFTVQSPVQSIKENLLDRFLKHFRKQPTLTPTPVLRKTSPAGSKTEIGPEPSRLPQSFLHEFEKKGSRDSVPPSSQDSYQNFLRKLSQQGRNES